MLLFILRCEQHGRSPGMAEAITETLSTAETLAGPMLTANDHIGCSRLPCQLLYAAVHATG